MSKDRTEANAGDAADESSALLQRPGQIIACELERPETHDEARSHNSAIRRVWRAMVNGSTFGNLPRTRRQVALFILGLLTLGAGVYLAVSIMTPSSTLPLDSGKGTKSLFSDSEEDIRIVLLADAHLIGPQYKCCSESNDVDNDSIMKTADRLREAQRKIEAISPPPAAVVFLGDVIHNGYVSKEFKWYEEHRNAYTVGGEIFGSFGLPVRYLWGNHDYHTTCGNASLSYDRFELSHRLFRHFLGDSAREFSAMKAGRYKLLFLNGMLGPSWEPTHPRCDTRQASLGERQLRWLAEELRGGEPAFVFLHHPLPATMRSEAPTLSHPDVLSLLLDHSNHIMAVFSGHYHRGLDWQDAYPFPHLTLPSCRYDSDNWFILQLPKAGEPRTWRLLDWDKNKGGARCSETWLYADPDPQGGSGSGSGSSGGKAGGGWLPRRQEPQPAEDGSCGSPSLERIDQVDLQPLEAADEVPGPAGRQFNPEPPCCLKYQQAFMDLCIREGPSKGCCAILGQHLRASSAAYGASCMCWPPFWQQAHQLFRNATRGADRNTTTQQQPPSPQQQQGQQQRQDIVTEVLERCVQNFGTQLQWPGRVGGSCLEPGSKQLPPAAAFA